MINLVNDFNLAKYVTHSGKFHADEVFSSVFLDKYFDGIDLIRINSIDFDTSDKLVYDIGFGEFDHHMKDFDKCHSCGVKYASFGLLFDKFGKDYLKKIGCNDVDTVFSMIENDLVCQIDGVDNGDFPKIESKYSYTSIDGIIGDFNPSYLEDVSSDDYFLEACDFASKYFDRVIVRCCAKALAKKVIDKKIEECDSNIMFLDKHMPFKDFIMTSDNPKAKNIYFVITPSNRGGYNVNTIPLNKDTHDLRCPLVPSWGGLFDDSIREVSGIETARFCHKSLFLACCGSVEDAILMAEKSMEYYGLK